MATPWTVAADVTGRWIGEKAIPADTEKINLLIADAEDTVLREFPDMQARIDRAAGTDETVGVAVPVVRVKKVVSRMVIRHLRNPEGTRSRMEIGGPFTENVTFGGDEPGEMHLTEEDLRDLGGGGTSAAFTIDQMPPRIVPSGPEAWLDSGRSWA